jgi:hypothetical protein
VIGFSLTCVSCVVKNQSHVGLGSLSKEFHENMTDERGYRGNFKIRIRREGREEVFFLTSFIEWRYGDSSPTPSVPLGLRWIRVLGGDK